jgi:hypothetical protein
MHSRRVSVVALHDVITPDQNCAAVASRDSPLSANCDVVFVQLTHDYAVRDLDREALAFQHGSR